MTSKQHLNVNYSSHVLSYKLRLILSFGHLLLHNSNVLLNKIQNKKTTIFINKNPPSDYNKCKIAFKYFFFRKSWSNIEFCWSAYWLWWFLCEKKRLQKHPCERASMCDVCALRLVIWEERKTKPFQHNTKSLKNFHGWTVQLHASSAEDSNQFTDRSSRNAWIQTVKLVLHRTARIENVAVEIRLLDFFFYLHCVWLYRVFFALFFYKK